MTDAALVAFRDAMLLRRATRNWANALASCEGARNANCLPACPSTPALSGAYTCCA